MLPTMAQCNIGDEKWGHGAHYQRRGDWLAQDPQYVKAVSTLHILQNLINHEIWRRHKEIEDEGKGEE